MTLETRKIRTANWKYKVNSRFCYGGKYDNLERLIGRIGESGQVAQQFTGGSHDQVDGVEGENDILLRTKRSLNFLMSGKHPWFQTLT